MRKLFLAVLSLGLFSSLFSGLSGVARADSAALKPLEFLVGSWAGDGKAEGAAGKGTTSFSWEVSNQVLVRRDHTEYAATADRPASTYEALMVIYKDPTSGRVAASYFDSGNHVIHYRLMPVTGTNSVQFMSDAPAGPVFRLSYALQGAADLSVTFEVKPPGASAFNSVAAGVVRRQ